MKILLWNMFGSRAFASPCDEHETHREIQASKSAVEFDFLSHLRVDEDLEFFSSPDDNFSIVGGTWDDWLENVKDEISRDKEKRTAEDDSKQVTSVTPTKPSAENSTHYILCESKVTGPKSCFGRLEQLEVRLALLCNRAVVPAGHSRHVSTVIALVGMSVPKNDIQSFVSNVKTCIEKLQNRHRFPLLAALLKNRRLFVVGIETVSERLVALESGLEKVHEGILKVHEEMIRLFRKSWCPIM